MGDVTVVFHEGELHLLGDKADVQATLARVAAEAKQRMKYHCPVSPVYPTYADAVALGYSRGQAYRGRGLARRGGPDVSLRRLLGDLPLRPSGYLRNSIDAFPSGGGFDVGPTADYGRYVNDGTRPHVIRSHGSWPLRNRATGQVFGRVVHHPGTSPTYFVQRAAADLNGRRYHT